MSGEQQVPDKWEVPSEIIARDPRAEKAYQQAIKEEKVKVNRGRIMLIGQDRAGKTSLKKSLLGLRFDPEEPSTVGVDVDPSRFSVDVDSAIEWKKLEGTPINDFDDYIARDLGGTTTTLTTETVAKTPTTPDVVDRVIVDIWDFAGQQLYYASHPVFFSPRAVYVLVYNLSKDLKKEAAPCVRQGIHDIKLDNHDKQTNLEAILSWLVSVHSVRPEDDGESREGDELPYLRPPVVIVGTHADCPFGDIKEMEAIIQKSLFGKSYNKHVDTPFIAVNNAKSSNDEGVHKLKKKVKKLFREEPYMEEYVPLRWFKFEKVIKSLVNEKGIHYLPLEELEKVVLEVCHTEDQDEIEAMLNFYHDLGDIVKYGKTVVLKVEWLTDVFKRLITIRPFSKQEPILRECWEKLEEKGILDMKLVRHVFKDLTGREGSRTEEDILNMMEQYGLIAKFGTEHIFHYFVPAQLQSSPANLLDSKLKASDPCALYIHFPDGFVPHGLYYCLVSKVIAWCSENKYHEPKLYKTVSQFAVGGSNEYELVLICRKAFIKVELRSLQEERSPDFKPAFLLRKYLEYCLEVMKNNCHGYCSVAYKISVLCPPCATSETECRKHKVIRCCDDDCLHLLPVKDPDNLVFFCGEAFPIGSVPGLEEWYKDPSIVHSQIKLEDNQKRWVVIGICLNVVLLPPLREFMKTKMDDHYCALKTKHNIHNQVFLGQLTRDGKCDKLNYRNINNNDTVRGKSNYDYKVQTAVDLAKLYLLPPMAKFKDFDEICDLSAVLGILCSAGVFTLSVRHFSKYVRDEVRNEWAHNCTTWDETKFETSFQMMDLLLKALNLSSDKEKTIGDQLKDWKEKGVELCMGNMVKAESVNVIEDNVARLCKCFMFAAGNQHDEAPRVLKALQTVQEAIKKGKEGIAVCQDLLVIIGVQDLLTIDAKTAADKIADYLQLNKSSIANPPDDVTEKCRAFCLQLKERGRYDIIKELRKTLPSGMTGPLLDDNTLYEDLDHETKKDLKKALCDLDPRTITELIRRALYDEDVDPRTIRDLTTALYGLHPTTIRDLRGALYGLHPRTIRDLRGALYDLDLETIRDLRGALYAFLDYDTSDEDFDPRTIRDLRRALYALLDYDISHGDLDPRTIRDLRALYDSDPRTITELIRRALYAFLDYDTSDEDLDPRTIRDLRRALCDLDLETIRDLRRALHDLDLETIRDLRRALHDLGPRTIRDLRRALHDLGPRTIRDLRRALHGADLWKHPVSLLEVPSGHLGYYGGQHNPAEAMLESNKNLTVGELYDKLVLCGAAALADTYL